jgi:hypothetical protein
VELRQSTWIVTVAQIAYLVLTHGLPYQTIDLLWSLWREEDAYFVHIDRKSPNLAMAGIGAVAAAYPNIHLVPSDICTWGGFSLVEGALRCLRAALIADRSWSHAALISGTHLPLRRAASLAAMLDPDCCYMNFHEIDLDAANRIPADWWSGVASRLTYEYQEVPGLGHIRGSAKPTTSGVTFFWGSQWWILSRRAAELVCSSSHGPLSEYFRSSAIPDEIYFQTILANSPLREQLRSRQLIWQRWSGNGRPLLLTDQDLRQALTSNQLFARKANEATTRDPSGILAGSVASADRAHWVQSVLQAFSDFLPPSILPIMSEDYGQGGGLDTEFAGSEMATRSLMKDISLTIQRNAADYGLRVQLSSNVSAADESVSCRFPDSQTAANYSLIVRLCNLEIAWIGLYVPPTDLDGASADLQVFSERELIDFSFPPARGYPAHHDMLVYGLRRKGVIPLDRHGAAENLEAVIREYLEILSHIPGMVPRESTG